MEGPKARLSYGTVRGVTRDDGWHCFMGIPYAAAPVGDARWRAPMPPTPWAGDRAAKAFGASAMQGDLGPMGELIGIASTPSDEDCLTLNVWTRYLTDEESAVLVWIHGGGNVVGCGAQPRIRGDYFLERGSVVVVTINYRLGAFGFLHAPELGATGNEALFDQIAALRWVRKEIRKFGGNPRDVTVAGQSAGAFDITQLMAMEEAAGCFDRVLLMSGSLSPHVPRDEAAATSARFAEKFGGYDALRRVPAQRILDFQLELTGQSGGGVRFGPVRDGELIRADAAEAIRVGTYTKGIPLLIGTTRDEWGLWTAMDPALQSLDDAGLEKLARRPFGDRAAEGVEVYRLARAVRGESIAPVDLWRAIMTDAVFRIPAIRTAELHSQHTPNTFMYLFDYASPALDGKLGACHSLDVPFLFGTTGVSDEMKRLCGDTHLVRCLAEVIHDSFVAFTKDGSPANVMFDWPGYDRAQRSTMRLGMESHLERAPMDKERAFWQSLG